MAKEEISISNHNTPMSVEQKGQTNINLTNESGGVVNFFENPPTDYDENGVPYTPLSRVRFDSNSRTIYLGNDQVTISAELVQPDLLSPKELPYVNALCEVYAEKLGRAIGEVTPGDISTLPRNLQRHYNTQRKSFYRADYVKHIARETFADGEQQFKHLEEDAYDGIENTYFDDEYKTGYERLKAVLNKITNITLDKSALMNVVGLIGNLEKEGICHILVNDDVIKSWVDIDG